MKATRLERILLGLTLIAACLFLGRASVFENESAPDAAVYAHGRAQMPFQGRFLMVPVVRFLLTSPAMGRVHLGQLSAVQIGFAFINGLCLAIIALLANHIAKLLGLGGQLYYVPAILTLIALAFTCCIHQEWGYYYYYDFPAYLFFALGLWAIVSGRFWLYVAISLLGMLNKETVLLLIPLWVAWSLREERWTIPILLRRWRVLAVALLIAIGLTVESRVTIHLFGFDRTAIGVDQPWGFRSMAYLRPWHLPQVFSMLGFGLPFAYLFRRLLPRPVWCLLMGMLPGLAVLAYAGVPMETRVYGEFAIVLAVTMAFELQGHIDANHGDRTRPVQDKAGS
jgi:hypothetical protein